MRRSRALAVTLAASAVSFPVLLGPAGVPAAARARACTPGSGPDLRGEDLADADDLPRNLRCADLTGATLNGADLTHRDLTGAILRDASLQGATLSLAHADGADLRGADFTGADLGQFRAKRVKLRGALLIGVYAEQAEFPRSDFTGAILSGAVLTQADLTGSTFASADLTKATMGQVKARGADFTRATMRGTRLGQAHLERAVFTSADLNRAVLTQASLDGADLNGANVNGATFGQARDLDLTGSRGTPADVPADALSPSPTEADRTPEAAQEAAHRAIANDPVRTAAGLLLVVLSGIGLGLTLLFWGLSHRRRKRDLAAFEKERVAVMDDLTRFGDEIDTVDAEMKSGRIDGAPGEWRAALDAYEAARHVLTVARTPYELQGAASAVQHGRASLHRVRTLLSDHGGQR
ncbi:pentapeptide repeat-containing protein [Microtetraspora glauca]|uniref:Pentapeptide repeat-containing protein n=1 Tax=Microtetraspora glauca TaxID=1996 RepID=A0ABV3G6L6_MICGL